MRGRGNIVRTWAAGLLAAAALSGCVAPPPVASEPSAVPSAPVAAAPVPQPPPDSGSPGSAGPHYRCDDGTEFSVRFAEDAALLQRASRGSEELLRDAGGVTPQQTVYSNTRMRAEFGLGADGRQAKLRMLQDQKVLLCTKV